MNKNSENWVRKVIHSQYFKDILEYLILRFEWLELKLKEEVAEIFSKLLTLLIVATLGLIIIVFAGVTGALILNDFLESTYLGFLIVTVLFSIVGVIIFLRKGKGVKKIVYQIMFEELLNKKK